MTFGILQRYVVADVVRAFAMALVAMTAIFVLFMVVGEASKLLLPRDLLTLIPYIIPSTLPYTVPVSMLFAVTVVYSRLEADNEIIAVKTAGLSAMTILWPAILMGGALSAGLLAMSHETIPRATHRARLTIFKNFEDAFYKALKAYHEINSPGLPFLIFVNDVDLESRTMFDAIFKHRASKTATEEGFDMVVQAKRAKIEFDMSSKVPVARIYFKEAEITYGGSQKDVALINDQPLEMEIAEPPGQEKRIQEWTSKELTQEQQDFRRKIARERKRQAITASLLIGSGRVHRVMWENVREAFINYGYWTRRVSEYETEKQQRTAQAFGSLFFVLLGAPVGIRFAKRDFLSAFITCFVPIITLYYPLMLLSVNLGGQDIVPPMLALWSGNVLLAILAAIVMPPVLRH